MTSLLTKILGQPERELTEAVRRHSSMKTRLDTGITLDEADFTVFDTELTGLDFKKDSIISIGAIQMRGSKIYPHRTFYRLVRPSSELKHQGVLVHEITHSELEDADEAADVLSDFLDFAGDSILVGHFVFIDVNFVTRAMKKIFGTALQAPAVDTSALHDWLHENDSVFARHHRGMTTKSDLFSMARKYGITVEKAHNAFYDAYITAQLFQRFFHFLPGCGVGTVKELLMISKG